MSDIPDHGVTLNTNKRHFRSSRSLMVQGTTSDAGKSAFATALCRLLADSSFRVAPFKPQNMALNSAVTLDGGEIGRAQAVQAQAARVEPVVAFNPILLKPDSDTGSQVIVNGFSIGHFSAKEYQALKPQLLQQVIKQHDTLLSSFDNVIIEGAGSPAEINLRKDDIANMGFAEAVDCPVVLISDIDRGGVFAHLVGTLALLSPAEQSRVAGFVINRFRGDIALLEPGIHWLEHYTGKPVLAVVPYLDNFHLEAEDGLSCGKNTDHGAFNIVVIALPRMSNHTDFDPLRLHEQVSLTFAKHPSNISNADLIIIPGSKNTRADLAWLEQQGWPATLSRHVRYGGKVLGICGGYQMLGRTIMDPEGVEGEPGSSKGLGFLPLNTRMATQKHLNRVKGKCIFPADNMKEEHPGVEGYEIHMGNSWLIGDSTDQICTYSAKSHDLQGKKADLDTDTTHPAMGKNPPCPLFLLDDGRYEGWLSDDGLVMGSYLHGLFDHPEALSALLSWAGVHSPETFDYRQATDREIDRLAEAVQQSLRPACQHVPVLSKLFEINESLQPID